MRKEFPEHIEKYRITRGPLRSVHGFGYNGAFVLPYKTRIVMVELTVIVSDRGGWDHVSVSTPHRCPKHAEMQFVKDIFFDPAETVVHFYPKKSAHINNHPFWLHLWRKHGAEYELPPAYIV